MLGADLWDQRPIPSSKNPVFYIFICRAPQSDVIFEVGQTYFRSNVLWKPVVLSPEPSFLGWSQDWAFFTWSNGRVFFCLEPWLSFFGWSHGRTFLAGAMAELFWLEPWPSFFGWSHVRAFSAGVMTELFWLELWLSFFGWSHMDKIFCFRIYSQIYIHKRKYFELLRYCTV